MNSGFMALLAGVGPPLRRQSRRQGFVNKLSSFITIRATARTVMDTEQSSNQFAQRAGRLPVPTGKPSGTFSIRAASYFESLLAVAHILDDGGHQFTRHTYTSLDDPQFHAGCWLASAGQWQQRRSLAAESGSSTDDDADYDSTATFASAMPMYMQYLRHQQEAAEHLILHHEAFLWALQTTMSKDDFLRSVVFPVDVKDAAHFAPPTALAECSAVYIDDLRPNRKHHGRVLRGTLAVDPFVVLSTQTVLEDERGDVVKVCCWALAETVCNHHPVS
jgi:hypothetical protein